MFYQFIPFIAFGKRASFDLRVVDWSRPGQQPHASFEFETNGLSSYEITRKFVDESEKTISNLVIELNALGLTAAARHLEVILYYANCEDGDGAKMMQIISSLSSIHEVRFKEQE